MREGEICSGGLPRRTSFQRNNRRRRDLIPGAGINPDLKMLNDQSHPMRHGGAPLLVAIVVATVGVLSMLIVDYGPLNKPQVKTAATAKTSTTGHAARDAGATITPTEPKRLLEPEAPGPKPVQPASPEQPVQDF